MYQVTIKGKGAMVDAFREEGIFVTFGDNAPDTLKDFCYSIDVNPVEVKKKNYFGIVKNL